jgi:hypothetical protein
VFGVVVLLFMLKVTAKQTTPNFKHQTIYYSIVAITFNSIAIGVGKLFTSTVVLQASTSLKYSP